MKAIVYHRYGAIDNLELQTIEKPTPKSNQVLLKVKAAAINSWDWDLVKGTTQGRIFGLFKPKWKILGCDVAGIVEAVGAEVRDFKVGDEIFGDISADNWGGFAEYVCADAKFLAPKSPTLTFEEAATIPQAGVLALQGLTALRPISKNQAVLINGAGGGVGMFGIQLAKYYGAEVTAVDNAVKLERLKTLGADRLIDYTQTDYTKTGQQYDLIIDNVAHKSINAYKRALQPNGIFKIIGGRLGTMFKAVTKGNWISKRTGKHIGILMHRPNREDLIRLNAYIEKGAIQPIVDKVFPLEETQAAFRYYEKGEFVGKIVIKVG